MLSAFRRWSCALVRRAMPGYAIACWLRDRPRRSVEFYDCTGEGLVAVVMKDPHPTRVPDQWGGEGRTVGLAMAEALAAFDQEGSDADEVR